jgi:hypothetical protein
MRTRLLALVAAVTAFAVPASVGAIALTFTHAYGELVDRGDLSAHIRSTDSTELECDDVYFDFPPLDDIPSAMDRLATSGALSSQWRNGRGCFSAPPPDQTAQFVEFFHAGLDHFFYTGDAGEIAVIEAGNVGPGWARTGKFFRAVTARCGRDGRQGMGGRGSGDVRAAARLAGETSMLRCSASPRGDRIFVS